MGIGWQSGVGSREQALYEFRSGIERRFYQMGWQEESGRFDSRRSSLSRPSVGGITSCAAGRPARTAGGCRGGRRRLWGCRGTYARAIGCGQRARFGGRGAGGGAQDGRRGLGLAGRVSRGGRRPHSVPARAQSRIRHGDQWPTSAQRECREL